MRSFEFSDGTRFDFAGIKARNVQRSSKTLSDSNERARKGFSPTFSMDRDFGGVVKFRLDWIFAKPPGDSGNGVMQSAFYPEMPQTMQALNRALPDRLSDHAPISAVIVTENNSEKNTQTAVGRHVPRQ